MKPLLSSLAGSVALCLVAAAGQPDRTETSTEQTPGGVLMQAMRDELDRTMQRLRMEQMESPYFVSYRVAEEEEAGAAATFGAVEDVWHSRRRTLSVEVRVGDAELDNSSFLPARTYSSPSQRTISLPLDDNYKELRRRLWLATDEAYKHALETLAKKTAALQNRSREDVPDFAAAEPVQVFEQPLAPSGDIAAIEQQVRELSALFRQTPGVHRSRVRGDAGVEHIYYVSSEGTAFIRARGAATVQATARTQSPDGDFLHDAEVFHADAWNELPPSAEMAEQVRAMAAALSARREAGLVERYSGPVLLQGAAAAELLAQAFAPRLLGSPIPVAGDARMDGFAASLRAPFTDRIGARVLPRFLDLRDDPTLRTFAGGPLAGGYSVDDDGQPSAPTSLIENGILKTLLTARNPVPGVSASTGNRRGAAVAPSNLLLTTEAGLSADDLRGEFMQLVAERGNEFGIVVRRLGTLIDGGGLAPGRGNQVEQLRLVRAYKVHPDGREELIRKSELVGLGDSSFKEIVAVSQTTTQYATQFLPPSLWYQEYTSAFYGRRAAIPTMSVSTPDLLFEEMTLRKPVGNVPRPPLATHPFFDKP